MRRTIVAVFAGMLVLAVTAPLAGATTHSRIASSKTANSKTANSKTVRVDKYAKSLCGAFNTWEKSIGSSSAPASDPSDPAAGQKALAVYFAGLVASTKTAIAKVKKAGIPDVDNAKQLARSFQTYLAKASTEISKALTQVSGADPSSPAFFATVAQVSASLATIDTRLGDPFAKVQSQDLLSAFKAEKSCKGVVSIVGA